MITVKLRDKQVWWVSSNLQDVKSLSAVRSIETGELILYDVVDGLPSGLPEGVFLNAHIKQYKPATKLPNSSYQRTFRAKQVKAGLALKWVPIVHWDAIQKFIRSLK